MASTTDVRREASKVAEAARDARQGLLEAIDQLLQYGQFEPEYEDESAEVLDQTDRNKHITEMLDSEKVLYEKVHEYGQLLRKYKDDKESKLVVEGEWNDTDIAIDMKKAKEKRTDGEIEQRNKDLDKVTDFKILKPLYKFHENMKKRVLSSGTEVDQTALQREMDEMKAKKKDIYNQIIDLFPVLRV